MEEILKQIQPYTTAVTAVLSFGILGLIFYLQNQMRAVYEQRVEAIKEQMAVTSERLEAAKDEIDRLKNFNNNINIIGAGLGIKQFQDMLPPGVEIERARVEIDSGGGDITVSGEIAGRDINKINNAIQESKQSIEGLINNCYQKVVSSVDSPGQYEYRIIKEPFSISPVGAGEYGQLVTVKSIEDEFPECIEKIESKGEGWIFNGFSSDYKGTEGVLLVFRRSRQIAKNYLSGVLT